MADFMNSSSIRFLGSDDEETQNCFTVGKIYHADCSSAGNFMVIDDNGDDWVIDADDDDFDVAEHSGEAE